MTAPGNLSFEVTGPLAGQADRWNHRLRAGARLVAGWARNSFSPLSRPNELDHADWTPVNLGATVPDAVNAPDGTLTADRLIDDATNGLHYLRRTAGVAFENGKGYAFGFFAKANTISRVGAYFDLGGGEYAYTCFDVSVGGASSGRVQAAHISGPGSITKVHGEVVLVNDGWYLCSTSFLLTGDDTLEPAIILKPDAVPPLATYAGVSDRLFVWGAFLHEGALSVAEGFEVAWDNDSFATTLTVAVPYSLPTFGSPPGTKEEEDFEELWGNSPYLTQLFLPTRAQFGPAATDDYEGFERGWDNDAYQTALTAPTPATFDPLALEPFEPFEDHWHNGLPKDAPVTATPLTDELHMTDQRFYEGQRVKFITGGVLPAPLRPQVEYFAKDVAATPGAFKVSESLGGPAVDLLDAGSGANFVVWKAPTSAKYFTADPGTDELDFGFGHGLQEGELYALGTTLVLPTPLNEGPYYLVAVTSTSVKLSTSLGGPPVDIIDAGSGEHFLSVGIATWSGSGAFTEDFEALVRDRTYVADAGADTLTSQAHGLSDGTTVFVVPPEGGSLPGGLNPTVRYFVVGATADDLQLSLTDGGPPVDVLSEGVGVQRLRGDPGRYWNELGFNAAL